MSPHLESVGLSEASSTTRLDLKGAGLDTTLTFHQAEIWRLGRHHVLLTCESDARAAILANLRAVSPPVYVTDVTSAYAQFVLTGPRSRDVLRKLTSLNVSDRRLPNLACAQTSLAHVHALVLRKDLPSIPAFHLLITRDYSESIWESLLHAGAEFGMETT